MEHQKLVWKIGGPAGFGIAASGMIFSRTFSRAGYYIYDYGEYPSLIRGGHNTFQVRIHTEPIHSMTTKVDILVALDRKTIDLHKNELNPDASIIFDGDTIKVDPKEFPVPVTLYPIPLKKITTGQGGIDIMQNTVAIAATLALTGTDLTPLHNVLHDIFAEKGDEVINKNKNVAKAGYDYIQQNFPKKHHEQLPATQSLDKLIIAGNESMILGALQAGCKFYAGYPMTPSSSLLHYMAQNGPKYNVVVKHAEDEISVINMAIGASFNGVRSMVGTAGGGFSLMVESYGLAGVSETPLVIIEGQRPGPATGMPTWTGQGDLQFVLNAAQDEWPRIVLAPGDTEECFYLTAEAFNIAEIYQTTVLLLTDKLLGESHESTTKFDGSKVKINRGKLLTQKDLENETNYLRYKITEDGISPRSRPGLKNGVFLANSYEHNEYGWAEESSEMRIKQMNKRMKKLDEFAKVMPQPQLAGKENAEITLIGWGSTKGPILDAIKMLESEGINANFLQIVFMSPFPTETVTNTIQKAKKTMIIEGNSTSQLGRLIREHTGLLPDSHFLKYDGRPFFPEEIAAKVKEAINVTD